MPRLPADALFAFFISCSCFTDDVLQNRHLVASRAPGFPSACCLAPSQRAALFHGGSSFESKETKFPSRSVTEPAPAALFWNFKEKPFVSSPLRRLGAAAALFEWLYTEWKFIAKNKSPSLIAAADAAAGYHNARCTKCHWDAVRPAEACLDLDAAPRSAPSFPPFSKISAAMRSVEPENCISDVRSQAAHVTHSNHRPRPWCRTTATGQAASAPSTCKHTITHGLRPHN